MYKVGVVLPTRGDRPEFLTFAKRQLERQTRQADTVVIVDDAPTDGKKDITKRYRLGCERLTGKVDVIFLIEDDDWYRTDYIETMLKKWNAINRPDVFGIGSTYYYHLGTRTWNRMVHPDRASAFCTMISSAAIHKIRWPKDDVIFTDIEIWKSLQGSTFIEEPPIAIGIKGGHANGVLSGGIGHRKDFMMKATGDLQMQWLRKNVDPEAFIFYEEMNKKIIAG